MTHGPQSRSLAAVAVLGLLLTAPVAAAADDPARPNVVVILADDLGYGDLGCYGGATPTPNIDRLAREGVRLTTFYANAPECTPTRTALLTGRYPQRVGGLECAIGVGNVGRYDDAIRLRTTNDLGLPADDPTLARRLRAAGYQTAAVGKWHLGYEPKFAPARHGFEYHFGPMGGGVDYFHHTEPEGTPMLYRNGELVRRDGYMTDLITEEAVAFVARSRAPFFLYVPYTAPHNPLQGPDDRRDRPLLGADFQTRDATPQTYAAMIRRLDDGVGAILRAVEAKGAAGNTLVVFTSDNGGTRMARNAPLSGNKSQTLEGGIRVPCLARWPGKLPAGAVSDHAGITMDLTASLVRAAGAAAPEKPFDGIDLLKHLEAGTAPPPRTLFWRYRRADVTRGAVRDGSLKWVLQHQGGQRTESLFDLARDVAEQTSLLAARPADAERLRGLYARWEADVRPSR